jgi:queuine/archaeosine tRNA-ribosyltransferase
MLFPIVQGGTYGDLRKESAEKIASSGLPGNAIGGLSVGEPAEEMYRIIEIVNDILPADKPRYLMGVGTPSNLLEAIDRGIDMFDCVMPTRNGRNGMIFTSEGTINIRNKKWMDDFSPIDPDGPSAVSLQYSKAYLRHLVVSGENLGSQIASIHNLAFYLRFVGQAREKIIQGNFSEWKSKMVKKLSTRLVELLKLKLIDIYIIRKFLGTFFFCLVLILAIAVVFDFAEKIDNFMEKEAPVKAIVFDYYMNFIPYFATLFHPCLSSLLLSSSPPKWL